MSKDTNYHLTPTMHFDALEWKMKSTLPTYKPNHSHTDRNFFDARRVGDAVIIYNSTEYIAARITGLMIADGDGKKKCYTDSGTQLSSGIVIASLTVIPDDADQKWIFDYKSQIRRYLSFECKGDRLMLENPDTTFADVTLCVDATDPGILAHRAILSSRSPWFARLFNGKFGDSTSGRVVLKTMNTDLIKTLLQYVYTGTVRIRGLVTWEDYKRALHVFHMMEFPELFRTVCSNFQHTSCSLYPSCRMWLKHSRYTKKSPHPTQPFIKQRFNCMIKFFPIPWPP